MWLPFLTSALVGGIIGYATNWLAIRMLFRPLTVKRLGPWRLPFTPGLIPRKRAALAKSLGQTVAQHLVTVDTLSAALDTQEFAASLEGFLNTAWSNLRTNEASFGEWLEAAGLMAVTGPLPELWAAQLSGWLPSLFQTIKRESDSAGPSMMDSNHTLKYLGSIWQTVLNNVDFRNNLKARWRNTLQQEGERPLTLSELLPEDLEGTLYQLLLNESPHWLDLLQDKMNSESGRILISNLIEQFLAGNSLFRLLATFTDSKKLAINLIQQLEKDEVRISLTMALLKGYQRLMSTPVTTLLDDAILKPVLDGLRPLLDQVSEPGTLGLLWQQISSALTETPELTQELTEQSAEALEAVLTGPTGQAFLSKLLRAILEDILKFTPASLLKGTAASFPKHLVAKFHRLLLEATATHGIRILEALRLETVVEDQVNALDIAEVEEILLVVMREQLTAITNLGFLLGALIGSLLPFINSLWTH